MVAAVAAPTSRHPTSPTTTRRGSTSQATKQQPAPALALVAAPLAASTVGPPAINHALPPLPDAAEAALARLQATPGVVATAVVHVETGTLARVGGDPETAARAVAAAGPLATLAGRMVTADDPADGLACLRVRSGRCELMVATGDGFMLVAVQAVADGGGL